MKSKLLLIAAVLGMGFSAVATTAEYAQLFDGTRGKVIASQGTAHTYVKKAEKTANGKFALIPGEYFVGTRVIKTDAGNCFRIRDKLIKIDQITIADVFVEAPQMQRDTVSVGCDVLAMTNR